MHSYVYICRIWGHLNKLFSLLIMCHIIGTHTHMHTHIDDKFVYREGPYRWWWWFTYVAVIAICMSDSITENSNGFTNLGTANTNWICDECDET